MQDLIGYDTIIENAMRSVIYETLKKVEKNGLLGKHYFMVTFLTNFSGVNIPKYLAEKYNEEMTIAVQYQYKNLLVEKDQFKISLSFGGKYEKLSIPYFAITSFLDPSINFGLRFSANYSDKESDEIQLDDKSDSNSANKNETKEKNNSVVDLSAKIISLDAFRKNKGNKT